MTQHQLIRTPSKHAVLDLQTNQVGLPSRWPRDREGKEGSKLFVSIDWNGVREELNTMEWSGVEWNGMTKNSLDWKRL